MAFTPFVLPATPFHRMRLLATLLLVAMAGVFAAALWGQRTHPGATGLGYLRAFAEASLVGGLADWFAVTALFRHPLGLPIPHTAIVPVNKDRIGDSLAAFLKDNFLTPAVMARRMEGFHVAAGLGRWLASSSGPGAGGPTGRLRRALGGLIVRFVGALDDAVVAQLLAVTVTDQLRATAIAPGVGRFLASLVADGRHEALVERAVVAGLDLLDAHAADIHAAVAERSGKWVPAFVDEKIAGGIVDAVRHRLLAMSDAATVAARRDQAQVMADFRERARALDAPARRAAPGDASPVAAGSPLGLGRDHPDRVAITGWLTRLAAALQDRGSPAAARLEAAKLDLLDSPATANLFASLWDTIKAMLAAGEGGAVPAGGNGRAVVAAGDGKALPAAGDGTAIFADGGVRATLAADRAGTGSGGSPPRGRRAETTSRFAAELGAVITANPALADALDTLARRAVVSVVATYGGSIVRLVSDTVRGWDAATVTGRLEAAVGRDLQYIRINGTVIGGLIGLAIHAVEVGV